MIQFGHSTNWRRKKRLAHAPVLGQAALKAVVVVAAAAAEEEREKGAECLATTTKCQCQQSEQQLWDPVKDQAKQEDSWMSWQRGDSRGMVRDLQDPVDLRDS